MRVRPAIKEPDGSITYDVSPCWNGSGEAEWARQTVNAVDMLREVTPVPDGDYYAFLTEDLTMGTFGHPWEGSLCVFGGPLIERLCPTLDSVLRLSRSAATAALSRIDCPQQACDQSPAMATSARTLVVMSESSPQDMYRRIIDALVARSGSIAERLCCSPVRRARAPHRPSGHHRRHFQRSRSSAPYAVVDVGRRAVASEIL
jgi:hypothetical protein